MKIRHMVDYKISMCHNVMVDYKEESVFEEINIDLLRNCGDYYRI